MAAKDNSIDSLLNDINDVFRNSPDEALVNAGQFVPSSPVPVPVPRKVKCSGSKVLADSELDSLLETLKDDIVDPTTTVPISTGCTVYFLMKGIYS